MNAKKRNTCCVCLEAPNHLYGLWEIDAESEKWSKKLSYSVPEVEWLDHFLICTSCSEQVEKICVFKRLCLEADKLRKSLVNKRRIPPIENSPTSLENVERIPTTADVEKNVKEEPFISLDVPEERLSSDGDPLCEMRVKVEEIETKIECEAIETKFEEQEGRFDDEEVASVDPLVDESSFQMNTFIENSCSQCSFNYTREEELIEHWHTTHESYKCDFCENTLLGSENFTSHVSAAHAQISDSCKIFKCFTCKHRFSSASDLYRHHRTHNYACDQCTKSFKTKGALIVHKKHKHSKNLPITVEKRDCFYFCKPCETHFSSYASLKLHNKAKHIDPDTWKYTCKVCARKFPVKQTYVLHMRRHLGVKPYACQFCAKTYVSNDELGKHVTAHKNGHPGKCFYCGEEHKQRRDMEQHLVAVHQVALQPAHNNRVRKRVCHICSKGFYDNNQLTKHIRTHTGERPYQCNECERSFSDNANLGHHLQRMHKRTARSRPLS